MPREMPEALRLIRNKYPAACGDARWKHIEELVSGGDAKDIIAARELAREITLKNPKIRIRHSAIIAGRSARNAFLIFQRNFERSMADLLSKAGSRMSASVINNSGDDGKISPGRSKRVIARIKDINHEVYKAINSEFTKAIRFSATTGLKAGQKQMSAAIATAKRLKNNSETDGGQILGSGLLKLAEMKVEDIEEIDPVVPELSLTVKTVVKATIFKKLFRRTLLKTMKAGIFGKTGVSNRIWDLRDENMIRLKRLVANGIARGDSAAKISRAVRSILFQPKTLRGAALADARPGVGVYRSAYKNALRVTRTETNRAFVTADVVFADHKDWKLLWVVSGGQRERDDCDILAAKSARKPFTPAEFEKLYPNHPHDLCYSVSVFPE